jgi:hypothetical protein
MEKIVDAEAEANAREAWKAADVAARATWTKAAKRKTKGN